MNREVVSAKSTFSVYFLLAVFVFTFIQTFGRNDLGPYLSPLLWFISGIAACLLALYSNRFLSTSDQHQVDQECTNLTKLKKMGIPFIGFFLIGASIIFSTVHLDKLIRTYAIRVEESDIIPTIQIFVQRFLEGDFVYDVIQYPGYKSIPTYLSFTWLPFIPAEIFDFDYRWLPFGLYVGLLLFMIAFAWYRKSSPKAWIIFVFFAAFVLIGLTKTDDANLRFGVEFLPAFYYLILVMSLHSKRWYFVAIGILLCLLSRYSFLFWLPAYAFIEWKERGSVFSLKVTLTVVVSVLAFYIIPFIGLNIDIILDGLKFYAANAPSKWTTFNWQPEGAKPYHLIQGYGLTLFFYDVFAQNVPLGITWIKRMQLILVALVSISTIWFYIKRRHQIQNIKLFLSASLGIYMIVFYSLMYAPYGYLFFVPLTVLLGLVWQASLAYQKPITATNEA